MSDHELKLLIEAADKAITAEDFDTLMEFYAEDATLVVKPGMTRPVKNRYEKRLLPSRLTSKTN